MQELTRQSHNNMKQFYQYLDKRSQFEALLDSEMFKFREKQSESQGRTAMDILQRIETEQHKFVALEVDMKKQLEQYFTFYKEQYKSNRRVNLLQQKIINKNKSEMVEMPDKMEPTFSFSQPMIMGLETNLNILLNYLIKEFQAPNATKGLFIDQIPGFLDLKKKLK